MAPFSLDIVDSHHHYWKLARGDYGWLTSEFGELYKDFLPEDYACQALPLGITKSVLVQAAPSSFETDFLLQLAEDYDFISGVVGWVNFDGDIDITCARLEYLSMNSYFKGIRPMLQDIEDTDWILNSEFEPIFQSLIKLGLTFDALVLTKQLKNIYVLATKYPDLKIVVDHCGKPNIGKNEYTEWEKEISRFEGAKNVCVKLSGLTTEASIDQQSTLDFLKYFRHVKKIFGTQRMMWGSDWPVVNTNSNIAAWLSVTKSLVDGFSKEEFEDFFTNTANNFYNL